MKKIRLLLCSLSLLLGCSVNRAVIDPFSFAPNDPSVYWRADCLAQELACCPSIKAPLCPPSKHDPLSLAEVLDIALLNNGDTQISWAEARIAAAEYGQTQSAFFPQISGEFFYTGSKVPVLASGIGIKNLGGRDSVHVNTFISYGPEAFLTYTLLDFGQRRYTSEAARYSLYFSDYTHNRVIQTVIETTTLNYYDLLYQKKLLEAYEMDLADARVTLNAAETGLQTGVNDISDVLQARTSMLLVEIELSQQQLVVKDRYNVLMATMGLPSTEKLSFHPLPMLNLSSYTLAPLETYLQLAMHNRPDLLAARAQVRSAEASLKEAEVSWTPVFTYSAEFGRTYFNEGLHDKYDYTSTFSVSMPFFTGFSIRNQIRQAEAGLQQAQALLLQNQIDVSEQVSTAHYSVSVSFQTLKAANAFLIATKEQYDVALSQYVNGVNTILNLVSAQSSLFDARAREASAVQQWFNSLAILLYATGIPTNGVEVTE